jgi:ribonuclease BN (tRNA processing enzyme)
MKMTVLGSSASTPTRTNPASGFLVAHQDTTLWMDAGTGTFMELARLTDPGRLDAVVISHMHVDHCSDLFGLYGYLAYGPSEGGPIPVYLPRGGAKMFVDFAGAGDGHVFHDVLEFTEVGPHDKAQVGPLSLSFGTSVHSVPANVTRIESPDRTLVYTGDAGPGGDLFEMASGADVFLSEAKLSGIRDKDTYAYHLTAREAGEIASWAGAGHLVLTHLPHTIDPEQAIDEASAHFSGPVSYATPGTVFDI